MSDLDDLEEIVSQQRYGYGDAKRVASRAGRKAFRKSQEKGGARNRALEKQQQRSSDRRRIVVKNANQA